MTMSSSLEGRAKCGELGKGGHGEPTVWLPGMHRKEKGEIPANLPKLGASAQILLVLALAPSPHSTGSSQVAWGHCEPQPEPSTQIQDIAGSAASVRDRRSWARATATSGVFFKDAVLHCQGKKGKEKKLKWRQRD